MEVYQHQNTDMTKVKVVRTLEDAFDLIRNAVSNYILVENLSAIFKEEVDASDIKRKVNQKLLELLLKDSPSVDKTNVGKFYGF